MANREQIRQQAAARARRLFARGRIEAFVQALLDGRDSPMQEVPVRDDHDYVSLLTDTPACSASRQTRGRAGPAPSAAPSPAATAPTPAFVPGSRLASMIRST